MLVDAAARSKGCTEESTHFAGQTWMRVTADCPRHAPVTVPARKLEAGRESRGERNNSSGWRVTPTGLI